MRFYTLLTKVQQSGPEFEVMRCSTEKYARVQNSATQYGKVVEVQEAINNDY